MDRTEAQLHVRLTRDDLNRLDRIIDRLSRQFPVPGRRITRGDAVRFALHNEAERLSTTEHAAPA